MAAINLKPVLDKIMKAINAGAERLEKEAEEFGYSTAREYTESHKEETDEE